MGLNAGVEGTLQGGTVEAVSGMISFSDASMAQYLIRKKAPGCGTFTMNAITFPVDVKLKTSAASSPPHRTGAMTG